MTKTATPSEAHLARTVEVMMGLAMCRTCEVSMVSHGQGSVTLRAMATEEATQPSGQLPGTVLYTLLDYAAFLAVATQLGDDQTAATHDAHFSFLDAAPKGSTLEITARVDRQGRSIAFIGSEAAWITPDGRRTLATARITKSIMTYDHRFRPRVDPAA